MEAGNQLGEFLRARRESVRPEQVGIAVGSRARRVPGLRREEVALLAGISAEYYVRLEQGRERNPSSHVVSAIARALGLDRASEDFLRLHAGLSPVPSASRHPVTDELARFVNALTSTPAYAHDRVLEVITSNALARAVSPIFTTGVNLIRMAFVDADLEAEYLNRDEMRARLVAYLRAQAATPPVDPRLHDLVAELSAASEQFRRLWARHDVAPASTGINSVRHPLLGDFDMRFERLCFAGSDDPVVLIYHPTPDEASVAAFRELVRIAATDASAQSSFVDSQSRHTSATSRQPASIVSE